MTREDVIRQIVQRDVKQKPLSSDSVGRASPALHAAACEYFGTWDTALRYAGVSLRKLKTREEHTPERLLRRIRRMCIDGYDMTAQRSMRRDPRFHEAACDRFGSWRLALKEAGVNLAQIRRPRRRPRKLDKDEIIQQIRQRHEAGLPMTRTEVCLDNQALATAAVGAFGNWGRVLAAAGLRPSQPEAGLKWTKEKVLAAIQERMRSGKPCGTKQMRAEAVDLYMAGCRRFGSWRAALEAASIRIPHDPGAQVSGS